MSLVLYNPNQCVRIPSVYIENMVTAMGVSASSVCRDAFTVLNMLSFDNGATE